MKKNRLLWLCAVMMMVVGMGSCSSDDDIAPAGEKSVVGYWQLVGVFNGTQQKPLTDVIVAKFGEDGELTYYKNGQQTNRLKYWLKPAEGSSNLYGFHSGDSPESEGTYTGGANLLIDGDMLRIYSFGCFSDQTCFYRRIASLDDIDPELSSILYEDNPTTIEGTWCMTQVDDNLGFVSLITPSTTWVHFYPDNTILIVNPQVIFLPSGTYSYKVVEVNEYSSETYTKINVEGQGTFTYSFIEGMLLLDDGEDSGREVYCFRKLKEKSEY